MTQINLLPWREELRKQKKIQFGIITGIVAGLSMVVVVLLHLYLSHLVSYQTRRNQYLEDVLANQTAKLMSFNKQKKEKVILDNKINFLLSLQKNNAQSVLLLDGIVRLVPNEIVLQKLSRENNKVLIVGRATAYTQITQLMENINKSALFKQPELSEISGKESKKDEGAREFQIRVEQKDYP